MTTIRTAGLGAILAWLLGLCILWAPAADAADAGDLDGSFGGIGRVAADFSSGDDFATAIAIRSNRIVAAGRTANGGGNFALAIYRPDGTLRHDTVITPFGGDEGAEAVAITPGLGIVAAGSTDAVGGESRFALARYFSTGALNATFGGDGRVVTDVRDHAVANAVAVQADGRIVAAGISCADRTLPGSECDFGLARYNTDGSLDTSFDGDGRLITGFGGRDVANALAIQADGKIVAAGTTGFEGGFALARYHTNGALDTSFDGDGKVVTEFTTGTDAASAVAIQADGKIVAAGRTPIGGGNFALARYNPDGSLDPTFAGNGRLTTGFGADERASGVAIQADGRIVAAGRTSSGDGRFALARYTAGGGLDQSFSGDGRVTSDFSSGGDSARAVAIQADGKIVAAGRTSRGGGSFVLARYHAVAVDEDPPGTIIESGPPDPTNDATPTFAFRASEAGTTLSCSIDGGAFALCASPHTTGPLADGPHVFQVRATDAAGNTDPAPPALRFTVDTAAPQTTIDSGPSGTIGAPAPAVAFSASEQGAGFECSIDEATFEPCTSPRALGPLADGAHSFRVRATDAAGNTDPTAAERVFTIDTTGQPPGGSPSDTTVTIRIKGRKLRLGRRGRAIVRLACPAAEPSGPCAGRLTLKTRRTVRFKGSRRRVTLAAGRFSVPAGETTRVRLRLTERKLRLLRSTRRARTARAIAVVRDQAGNRSRVAKRIRVRPNRA